MENMPGRPGETGPKRTGQRDAELRKQLRSAVLLTCSVFSHFMLMILPFEQGRSQRDVVVGDAEPGMLEWRCLCP